MSRQTLTLDTLAGPRPLPAPSGWKFDKTATTTWYWLIIHTRRRYEDQFKTVRERYANEAVIDALANVLANSLGMAATYWMLAARELIKEAINAQI